MISYLNSKKETWPVVMAEPEHDVELVLRIAAGEDSGLRELYAAHGQRL